MKLKSCFFLKHNEISLRSGGAKISAWDYSLCCQQPRDKQTVIKYEQLGCLSKLCLAKKVTDLILHGITGNFCIEN